jgi:S1-C subfamily serine protease
MMLLQKGLPDLLEEVLPAVVAIQDRGRGLGAGFIWQEDSLILTNSHVVLREQVEVSFADGRREMASLLARDPEVDLAVLRIPPVGTAPLRPADLAQLRPGQLAVAVGHPFGLRYHLTFGILSAIDKAAINGRRKNFPVIRTDLALLPGNSGGPLLDAAGCVMGVNTMVVGGDQGFAVPVSLAVNLQARTESRKVGALKL